MCVLCLPASFSVYNQKKLPHACVSELVSLCFSLLCKCANDGVSLTVSSSLSSFRIYIARPPIPVYIYKNSNKNDFFDSLCVVMSRHPRPREFVFLRAPSQCLQGSYHSSWNTTFKPRADDTREKQQRSCCSEACLSCNDELELKTRYVIKLLVLRSCVIITYGSPPGSLILYQVQLRRMLGWYLLYLIIFK